MDLALDSKKDDGVCCIKPEFVLKNYIRSVAVEHLSPEDKEKFSETINTIDDDAHDQRGTESITTSDDGSKKRRGNQGIRESKKKLKGQNRQRDVTYTEDRFAQFCRNCIDTLPEIGCTAPSCDQEHNLIKYLASRPPEIASECSVFQLRGYCPSGVTCRFSSCHIGEGGRNIVDFEKREVVNNDKSLKTLNVLSKDVQRLLWKKKYDFSKSDAAVKAADERWGRGGEKNKEKKSTQFLQVKSPDVSCQKNNTCPEDSSDQDRIFPENSTDSQNNSASGGKTLGAVDDAGEIKLRMEEKKKIDWRGKLYLSPLTTVGNLPFRRICVEYGADITCGEMMLALPIVQGTKEWVLTRRHPSEKIFGVQICGKLPHLMAKAAQVVEENCEVDFIDINMGCPIDALYQQGCGSGLMTRKNLARTVATSMVNVLNVPLTIKMRMGVCSSNPIAHELLPLFRPSGISLATIHGRSREQRYTKSADWAYIEKCAQIASPMPVFGNGDILSYEDYSSFLEQSPSVAGAMIGRGALIKPWIFKEIKEQRHIDMPSSERLAMLQRYVCYGLDHWGSDTRGVETTRRFLLEWLSFLHRYVPFGVLGAPPQQINQRPPPYIGRDDLETKMASSSCSDWVAISEMLLGKVPEGFHFLPKHKANAWK